MSGPRIRPAREADLPALTALRRGTPVTLPAQPQELLLVAEDAASGALRASLRLRPAIGLTLPRCWYHVGCTVHAAPELKLFHRQRTLLLGNDHTGASELADLAWDARALPLAGQAAVLRLLIASALLALAGARSAYAPQLIAELPGLRDSAGQSPFWAGLGRHFYGGDPADAQARFGDDWRSHVAALLPRHPVVTSFLPPAAQAAIAQVAPEARLLRELLEEAGLRYSHHVRVDDAGPVLEADLDALPAVIGSRVWTVGEGEPGAAMPHLLRCAAPDGEAGDWQACRVPAKADGPRLLLAAQARATLGVQPGDRVWALPFAA